MRTNRTALSIQVLLMCLFVSACALSRPVTDAVFADGPRGAVYHQSVDDSWFKAAHPVSVSPRLLTYVLRGVQVQGLSDDSTTAVRAFPDEDIEFLSPLMSTALSKATKSQLVAFRVVRSAGVEQETTGGVLYLQGRLLHLALTHYRAESAGRDSGTMLDRQSRNPRGLEQRQLHFLPETAQRSSANEPPDLLDQPPLATIVIDYKRLAADLHLESPTDAQTDTQSAQPDHGIPTSQETQTSPAEETRALKELVKEQAIELDALKEDMRALRRKFEMETPSPNQTKPSLAPTPGEKNR